MLLHIVLSVNHICALPFKIGLLKMETASICGLNFTLFFFSAMVLIMHAVFFLSFKKERKKEKVYMFSNRLDVKTLMI